MKKLLLLLVAFATISMTAQVTVFEDDFETETVDATTYAKWTVTDADGDTENFEVADFTTVFDATSHPMLATGLGLDSDSWESGNANSPMQVNNYITTTDAIDLSGASGTITLSFLVGTYQVSGSFIADQYSIYMTASNDAAVIETETPIYNGVLSDLMLADQADGSASAVVQNIDLSALAGIGSYYLTFRHHDTFDENSVLFDNISIVADAVGGDIVSLIGTGSPSQDWGVDTDMTDLGGGLYELNGASIYDGELKFRQNHDWTVNWGSDTFPSGTGVQDGPNVPSTVGTYDITFNANTGDYVFTATASVNDLASVGFTYAPNPTANFLTMKANAAINNVVFYNILGEKVLQVTPNNLESSVDVSRLSAGAYFAQVQVGDSNGTFKVIKK